MPFDAAVSVIMNWFNEGEEALEAAFPSIRPRFSFVLMIPL